MFGAPLSPCRGGGSLWRSDSALAWRGEEPPLPGVRGSILLMPTAPLPTEALGTFARSQALNQAVPARPQGLRAGVDLRRATQGGAQNDRGSAR